MAMPPQINAAPRAVLKTILGLLILRILLFERFRNRKACKPEVAGEVALSRCEGEAVFQGAKKRSKRTQNRQCPKGQVSVFAAAN